MKSAVVGKIIRKHPVGVTAALLTCLLGIGWFVRSSAVPEYESLRASVLSEKARLEGNVRNSAALQEHVDALVRANEQVKTRLVRVGDLASNQQYFYKIETETGVKISDLRPIVTPSPKAGAAKGIYTVVSYSCSVQGSYPQILAFLQKLETGIHYQRIVSGSLVPAGGAESDANNPLLTLSISVDLLGQS